MSSSPYSEESRLKALEQLEIIDSPPETAFDNLTSLAARLFRVPIVLISFLERERQWFKSHYGLDLCETSRDISFCVYTIQNDAVFIVPDATQDKRFATNPSVTDEPHVRFYAGAPLRTPDGLAVGTLCLIDTVPRTLERLTKGRFGKTDKAKL